MNLFPTNPLEVKQKNEQEKLHQFDVEAHSGSKIMI